MFFLDAFHWSQLLQPQFYIDNGGLWLVLFIIFAETGLFAGFFLPGDSLLFVAGIFSTQLAASLYDTGSDFINLLMIIALASFAGIIGNTVGYWFGRKIGPAMFTWRDRFLFKKRYLYQARDFYEKHGGGAIIFARFLPIVRTFAPIVAGIVGMDRKKFGFFNIVGSIAWTASMLAGGHYLQKLFLEEFNYDLKEHLEVIVLGIVLVTTAPVLLKIFFGKRHPSEPIEPVEESETINQSRK
jgi:membrane-associated protein